MTLKKLALSCVLIFGLTTAAAAQTEQDNFGQTIQITTQLNRYLGQPSWLLIIRDLDHGQNIPYLYDFESPNNFWLAFTYGRNYLITASQLTFNPYQIKVNNFCGLESRGRIIRGLSLYITLTGALTPHSTTFNCHVLKMQDNDFTVAPQNPET